MARWSRTTSSGAAIAGALADAVRAAAVPIREPRDLDALMELVGDARYVLLGEASHGTHDFYAWRTEISKRLIREKGFSFIAVEGDWPDCYRVNRYVKGFGDVGANAVNVLHAFSRWPTWMWANRETVELVEWLRRHNNALPDERRVGFYGLDVYSLYDSLAAVLRYLERLDPEAARLARRACRCFEPYAEDAVEYARATALVPTSCEDEAVEMLRELRGRAPEYSSDGREAYFDAEQNALVARNAERYYRTMIRGGSVSWNVRDHHMNETLDRLVTFHGERARAIVWEHNTHVGDARFTDMAHAGMVNVGQLVRQGHEHDGVVLVGFGTHHGSVIAAEEWGLPMRRMLVPPALGGSYEELFHQTGVPSFLLCFGGGAEAGALAALAEPRGHRAIGVVYDPRRERWGNYVPTVLPGRYDAFIYLDATTALDPLHTPERHDGDLPETYPSGM